MDILIMDFVKAYDKVLHWRLMLKLKIYGVSGSLNKWTWRLSLATFQRVVCNGEISKQAPAFIGLPQSLVISPLLFVNYINEVPKDVDARGRLWVTLS